MNKDTEPNPQWKPATDKSIYGVFWFPETGFITVKTEAEYLKLSKQSALNRQ